MQQERGLPDSQRPIERDGLIAAQKLGDLQKFAAPAKEHFSRTDRLSG
jgi:hypothetical protein